MYLEGSLQTTPREVIPEVQQFIQSRWRLFVGVLALTIVAGWLAVGAPKPQSPTQLKVVVVSSLGPDPPSGYILEAETLGQIRSLACPADTPGRANCWPDAKPSHDLVLFAVGGFTRCLHIDHVTAFRGPDSVMLHFYRRKGSCASLGPGRPMLMIGISADKLPAFAKQGLPRAIDHPDPPVVLEYLDT
jgi:hypothetical protein